MANYAIGDVHGCFEQLQQLLQYIAFNPGRDTIWLTGDLVNRGPQSLEVLRWAAHHSECVHTVLGNHDLHLLALSEGCRAKNKDDTLNTILNAPDSEYLFSWLRQQPLINKVDEHILVHAGLLPSWDTLKAIELAAEIQSELQSPDYPIFLSQLYNHNPKATPSRKDSALNRWKTTVNSMTRMRCLTHDGQFDFSYLGTIDDMPSRLVPWFWLPSVRSADDQIIFGHWSAIGPLIKKPIFAIDGGCAWGRQLIAMCLDDQQLYILPRTTTD